MNTNQRVLLGVAVAVFLAATAVVFLYLFWNKREATPATLAVEWTAEGQSLAAEETPKILWNGLPFDNGSAVKPGKGLVAVQSAIFRDVAQEIEVQPGKRNQVGIDLKYRTGSIEISTEPAGAGVFRAGKSLGRSPLKLLGERVGPREYSVTLEGWDGVILKGDVEEGKEVKLRHRFPNGNVSITSDPRGATIKQGERVLGATPLELKEVPVGDVRYTLEMDDYRAVVLEGKIKDREDLRLNALLISFAEEAHKQAEDMRKMDEEQNRAGNKN